MEKLDLSRNKDINDTGAEFLLDDLKNIKSLSLKNCNISNQMQIKLFERGCRDGCKVSADISTWHLDVIKVHIRTLHCNDLFPCACN